MYIIFLGALILVGLSSCQPQHISPLVPTNFAFWPPDLVPHPHCPDPSNHPEIA